MSIRFGKLNGKVLGVGLAIIVFTNVVALAGVAYNRSGEPDAVVELTERELGMPYRYGMNKENTGLALRINCRIENAGHYQYGNPDCRGNPEWLNSAKLIELGFTLEHPDDNGTPRRAFQRALPHKVYLVLELNGKAYQRAISNAETKLREERALLAGNPGKEEFEERVAQAEKSLDAEQHINSRLFAIDAGLDNAVLRKQYPDTSQYLFLQALVRPFWSSRKEDRKWQGTIKDLLIDAINIPLEHRALFKPWEEAKRSGDRASKMPRYTVRIAFGKRAEPWVLAVGKP